LLRDPKQKENPEFYLSKAGGENVPLSLCAEGPPELFTPLGSVAGGKHTGIRAPEHVIEFDNL